MSGMNFDGHVSRFDHRAALRSLAAAATAEQKATLIDQLIEKLPDDLCGDLASLEDRQLADFLLRGLEIQAPAATGPKTR